MPTTLVSVDTLSAHLDDPDWLIVDCRFDLSNPAAGEQAFAHAHIPGAIYAHLDRDLSSPVTARTGRHPLPKPQDFADRLAAWGVTFNTQVVAYDADVGVYASRLWWMLRWLGHENVAVLDGGLKAWLAAGLKTSTTVTARTPTHFQANPDASMCVDAQEVAQRANDSEWRILDARDPERFRGDIEPLDTVAGHIPGARNHPFATNVVDGHLAPKERLRQAFDATQAGVQDRQTIVMCGSGVTACHLLLAMEVAGKAGARLYSGSWSEWIRDPSRPVERG
jgi:thiosulfate/3-mercaptopyruvate sulfurtransferase